MTGDAFVEDGRPRATARIVAVIALGGAIGALARYGISDAWPAPAGGFPWATFAVNVSGSFALGALMAWMLGREATPWWMPPFFGTGVLGGYTTFSTYAVEADGLVRSGHEIVALTYVGLSVVISLGAVWAGFSLVGRGRRDAPQTDHGGGTE